MLMFDCIVIPSFGVFYLIFRVRLRARENLSGETGGNLIGHRRDEKNLFRELGYKYQDYWKSTEQRTAFGHSSMDLRKLDEEYVNCKG
jgi:hypothetical protein